MSTRRPDIVLVLADDMGFSDIGCFGGEIETPHIDRLAREGVRLTQFYNTARCSPSRASLLTGLHPHQVGVGILNFDDTPDGYPGDLAEECADGRRGAARRRLRDVPLGQVAPLLRHGDAQRQLADAPRLRPLLRHARGRRQLLPAADPDARRGERRARGRAAGLVLHRRDQRRTPCPSSRSTTPSGPTTRCSSTSPTPRRTGRCTRTRSDVERYAGRFDEGWDALREERLERLVEDGHPVRGRRRHGAGRARPAGAGLGRDARRPPRVGDPPDGGVRRAGRPDGPGRRTGARRARAARPPRRHAGGVPVRQRRLRRGARPRVRHRVRAAAGHHPRGRPGRRGQRPRR